MLRFREVVDYVKLEFSSVWGRPCSAVSDPRVEILRKGSQLNLLGCWSGRWMGHSKREHVGITLEDKGMEKPETRSYKISDKQHALDFMLNRAVCDCIHGMNGLSLRWGCTVGRDDTSGGWQLTQSLRQMANQKKKPKSVKSNPWSSSLWDRCETVNTVPHGKNVTPDLSNNTYINNHKRNILSSSLAKRTCAIKHRSANY